MATVETALPLNNTNSSASGTGPVDQTNDLLSLTVAALVTNQWITVRKESAPIRPRERIISLDEVSWHDHACDCWIIIYDRVYDITDFLNEHPGGADVLLEYAGRDATIPFRGTGHSKVAEKSLGRYLIGYLSTDESIYRKPGGIQLSHLPE